jgi:hypothetical protein
MNASPNTIEQHSATGKDETKTRAEALKSGQNIVFINAIHTRDLFICLHSFLIDKIINVL